MNVVTKIGQLNAGLHTAGLSVSKPVVKAPIEQLENVTSLREVFAQGLARPGDLDDTVAHAIIDAGSGQGHLVPITVRGGRPLNIDFPFGTSDVTSVPPQLQNKARVAAEQLLARLRGDVAYARQYGDDLSIKRTDDAVQGIIGWDKHIAFDAGSNVGKLRSFDMDRLATGA